MTTILSGEKGFLLVALTKIRQNVSRFLPDKSRSSCIGTYSEKYGILTGFGNTIENNDLVIFKDLWVYN